MTGTVCPSSVCRGAPVPASHSLTALSSDSDARSLPSGENVTAKTESVCPSSVCRGAPVPESHSLTALSWDADARSLPSGENATATTEPVFWIKYLLNDNFFWGKNDSRHVCL